MSNVIQQFRGIEDLQTLIQALQEISYSSPTKPDLVYLGGAVNLRLVEKTLTDGSKVHDLNVTVSA